MMNITRSSARWVIGRNRVMTLIIAVTLSIVGLQLVRLDRAIRP
jgi:hypothetical protein